MSTFKEWNQLCREQQTLSDRLRESAQRRWVIDPQLVDRYRTEPSEFSFYVSSWPVADGEIPVIRTSSHHFEIDMVPAKTLRRIAAVKQLYEDWATGKIAELPTDCPREILELP